MNVVAWRPPTPADRFWRRVTRTPTCWIWRDGSGYGRFWDGERRVAAHRYSYELHVGPIPAGYQVDHLCRVPACVNPEHLEAVTPWENLMRSDSPFAAHHAGRDCGSERCGLCARIRSTPQLSEADQVRLGGLPVAVELEARAERREIREWAESVRGIA